VTLTIFGALAGCAAAPTAARTPHSLTGSTTSPLVTAAAGTPLGAGQRVWAAFADAGLPYDQWWAQLMPLLSDAARAIYVYDDPRRIPSMTVRGTIHLAARAPGEPNYTAEVIVPTSKGEFGLDLERHTLTSPWLLYAIKFPSAVQ
jgi:hypothetical protein